MFINLIYLVLSLLQFHLFINRPGVAGAFLQSPLLLIDSLIHSWFVEISSLASRWPSDHMTSSRPLIGQPHPIPPPFLFPFFVDKVVELLG